MRAQRTGPRPRRRRLAVVLPLAFLVLAALPQTPSRHAQAADAAPSPAVADHDSADHDGAHGHGARSGHEAA
ncbi:MAG TPA: hypothetical protein VK975_02630, partial [Acidimicrobiales bacterium]|nr:hypothetical protein [Acidimicrobiales bacterium]